MVRVFFLITCLSLIGCSQGDHQQDGYSSLDHSSDKSQKRIPQPSTNVDGMVKRIRELNKDKQCLTSFDCGALAIGHRACGGPDQFWAYSHKNKQLKQLMSHVVAYKRAKLEQQKRQGIVSICQIIDLPQIACVKYQCQILKKENI